jgi:hypothetical protein
MDGQLNVSHTLNTPGTLSPTELANINRTAVNHPAAHNSAVKYPAGMVRASWKERADQLRRRMHTDKGFAWKERLSPANDWHQRKAFHRKRISGEKGLTQRKNVHAGMVRKKDLYGSKDRKGQGGRKGPSDAHDAAS